MEAVATAPAAPCARRTGALPQLCPLCGGGETAVVCRDVQDYEYGAPGTYQWLRCTGCGLIRLDPVPTAAILDQAYPPHYHAEHHFYMGIPYHQLPRCHALMAAQPAYTEVVEIERGYLRFLLGTLCQRTH